jgi:hypothetical protein
VVRKVNLNFGGMKINDSKKRQRPVGGQTEEREMEDT